MSDVIIRRAVPEDLDAVSALYGDLYGLLYTMTFPFTFAQDELDDILNILLRSKMCCLAVAEADGAICGFLSASVNRMDRKLSCDGLRLMGKINDICVAPAYRGSGVADKLLEYVEAWLTELGVPIVESEVICENQHSLRWFQKHGYLPFCQLTYKKLGG